MTASDRARIWKERRQALALDLIEALALRHHVRFGVAKLWRRTGWNRGERLSLEIIFHVSKQAWCHAALVDVFAG